MKKRLSVKGLFQVFKESFKGFGNDNVTKLSGSLAYYTVFSLGPLMVVIISLCSIFLGRDAIEGKVYEQLVSFVGADTALQLQQVIKNGFINGKGTFAAIVGVITLLIGATTVFGDIQDSINKIWNLKPKPKKGWLKMLRNRFLSFSVIASLGFLLLVSLGISAIIEALINTFKNRYPDVAVLIVYIINLALTFGITTLIFAVIFKVLPDAQIKWKDIMSGAITTAILFMLGKFGISLYISKTNVGSTYGAAGSIVILLVWVYFSSIILYFGAEFTKAYAVKYGSAIHPNDYAVTTKQVEVETGQKTVQSNEKTEVPVAKKRVK
jgi:membrane protein